MAYLPEIFELSELHTILYPKMRIRTRWYVQNPGWMANSVESDQTPRNVASNLVGTLDLWRHRVYGKGAVFDIILFLSFFFQ